MQCFPNRKHVTQINRIVSVAMEIAARHKRPNAHDGVIDVLWGEWQTWTASSFMRVTLSLLHDIRQRTSFGHYEISSESVDNLNRIWMKLQKGSLDFKTKRTDADTFEEMKTAITDAISSNISRRWKAKDFELFCEAICNNLDYVQVAKRADTHRG